MFDESLSRYWSKGADTDRKVIFTEEQIDRMPPRLREIYESIKDNDEALRLFEKYTETDEEDMEIFIEVWERMNAAREQYQAKKENKNSQQ